MKHKANECTDLFITNGGHAALLSFSVASRLDLIHVTYHVKDTLMENNLQLGVRK